MRITPKAPIRGAGAGFVLLLVGCFMLASGFIPKPGLAPTADVTEGDHWATTSGVPASSTPLPFLDGTGLDKSSFLYGSEIGSWPIIQNRYDGQPMLNYGGACATCPELAKAAAISVVRWGIWNVFDGMTAPAGETAPTLSRDQFDAVVDGIRGTLGAEPFIKLPPGESDPVGLFCPDTWGLSNLRALDHAVVQQAGSRVRLYEFANEPEIACGYENDWDTVGAKTAQLWIAIVPDLKKYARQLGFEIYIGGPSFATTHVSPDDASNRLDVNAARHFIQAIHTEYETSTSPYYHDPDLIPSFYSFHAYGSEFVENGGSDELSAIPYYGRYVDTVKQTLVDVWGPDIGSRIRIACTEWNIGEDDFNKWSSPEVPMYYSEFLRMLKDHGVWMANQFLVASNGNGMDMITEDGHSTPYYEAFRVASTSAR